MRPLTLFLTDRRQFFICLVSVLLLILCGVNEGMAQDLRTYSVHFNKSDFWVDSDYDGNNYIYTKDTDFIFGTPDELCIPKRTAWYALPFGTAPTKVTITYSEKKLFKENVILANNPKWELTDINIPSGVPTAGSDENNPVSEDSFNTAVIRIIPICSVKLCPFVYEEDSDNLYFMEDATISIELGDHFSFTPEWSDESFLIEHLDAMVENKK